MFTAEIMRFFEGIGESIGIALARKRSVVELRSAHQIYRKAIENAHGVPYRLRYRNSSYDFFGEGCEELLGIPYNEITFNKMDEIVKEIIVADQRTVSGPVEYASEFRTGRLKRYKADYRIVTPQGREKWISDCSLPIFDDETGKVIGALGILYDITDRKKAEEERHQHLEKIRKTLEGTINVLASAVEMRDPYTAGHQRRVAQLACAIAKEMRMPDEQVEAIRLAALIHDIGKIAVPSEILSKPSVLGEMEMTLIRSHPQVSYDILKRIEFPWPIERIVYQHHERLDASGYPLALSAKDLLPEARILAVADVVEAMSSHRPYRPSLGVEKALQEIKEKKGVLFDPDAVDACMTLFAKKDFKFE
jgi:putative nucleotidyltransferase with HDIG domain/PAS domain S-box-containing protein